MTQPTFPIRPVTRDEFENVRELMDLAFSQVFPDDRAAVFQDLIEYERSLIAFDGDRPVASAGALTYTLHTPGATVPAAGITGVTVHPAYRRRGLLSALMTRQLGELHEGAEPVAALWASESRIYGRYGYAPGTEDVALDVARHEAALVPDAPDAGHLTVVLERAGDVGGAVHKELSRVYEAAAVDRPGTIDRAPAAWTESLLDTDGTREGATRLRALLVRAGDEPRGYALYRVVPGEPRRKVRVDELVALDGAAYVAIWRHLVDLDLTERIAIGGVPVDSPLLRLLANPRVAGPQLSDGLWVRLVRLGEALAARRYAAPVDLVLDVTDARCPWNARRWRLAGDGTGATCEPTTDPADVTVDTTALAAAYLGGGTLAAYATTGRVAEHTDGALRRLSTALGWDPRPWCCHNF